jgi:hypothetical protein
VPSQATIQAIKSPKTRSGQYTSWKQSESSISYAGSNGRSDSNGFPAYVGAAGNKAADRAAKEASENSLEELEPDTLRVLKGTTKSIIRKTIKVELEASWGKAKRVG